MDNTRLIRQLPKAELHLHIEGSLEPELMMQLAKKHKVTLPYQSIEQVKQAYNFDNLQSFLDLYYLGASVLRDEDDFYQLMWRYLLKCREENVVHCELMFDPQTHTERGIGFDIFMPGFLRAIEQAKQQWGQSCLLIMCFLRHLPEQSALQTLQQAQPYLDHIEAVGLDSSELGHPPEKFTQAFAEAKKMGLKAVAHAGEEGPPDYIWSAINTLKVDRIDHGVRSIEDPALMTLLKEQQIPLTVCPLSNIKLCVFDHMSQHNILKLLDAGLLVTVNADDPSYFGGYLNDNFLALDQHLGLQSEQIKQLVSNSFNASFLDDRTKQLWLDKIQTGSL
ncbi:adenosine deaminase [Neptunicella sp. SCSIO 80796]|uniref:adenosine deaminase n=1 Tax=Neptunicella plasticusilytica TaxID=3117012 RepID=UPI003A4D3B2D